MIFRSHARATGGGGGRTPAPWWWRVATPLAVLLCGALFAVSAHNSQGTDLRPGRYTDLASLVRNESNQYDALRGRVAQLNRDVASLTTQVHDEEVNRYQRQADALKAPAGLVAQTGPGVSVTLSDAPLDVREQSPEEANLLVVHQQDIQAVVNAMWLGGATAVTVAGQRIVSTTGIKCIGNAVQLQGVPYPQPYVISAVGDPAAIQQAIDNDSYVQVYREDAANPTIAVGWDMRVEDSITAPAYDGLLDLRYAKPLTP